MPGGPVFRVLTIAFAAAFAARAQQQALNEAERLDEQHKCGEAEQYYQKALASGPASPSLLNNLGNHYLTCGAPAKARDAFAQLLKINSAHVNANLQMARLALAARDGSAAIDYLSRINAPGDPEILLVRAEALQQTGKRDAAARILTELSKNADPRLLFALGITCGRLGLYEKAESAFSKVLAGVPGDFEVLYNLGVAAARARHYDRAQHALEAALKARPGDVDSLYELGRVESERHDYNRAVFLLAQAMKLAPQRPDVVLATARAAQMAGFYGDSILAYDEYLKLRPPGDPADDIVRRDRALLAGFSRDGLKPGIRDLTAYLEKHPNDAIGHYDLAQLYEREDRSKALAEVSAAVRLSPDFEPAHFFRAWLLQKLGREEDSIAEVRTTVRLNPADARAFDLMGLNYLNLEKPAEAEKALREAARLSPDEPDILFHLSRALMELGRGDEAKPFLEKFEKVRGQNNRGPREEPGMIETASMSPAERSRRVIEQLQKLVEQHPGDTSLRVNLATALLTEGRIEPALAAFRELLAMKPAAGVAQEAGAALLRYEQYGLARDFLERAAAERPESRLDLAIALFFTDGPKQALAELNRISDNADRGDSLLLEAKILEASGQIDEAGKAVQQSLRYSLSRPRLAEQAALLLARHKREGQAFDLLGKAAEAAPDDAGLKLARVVVLASAGRNAEAEKASREIEKRWPEWDRAYLIEGLVLERESRIEEAKRRIGIALTLGVSDNAAKCALARMSGSATHAVECSCQAEIYEAFFPVCAATSR